MVKLLKAPVQNGVGLAYDAQMMLSGPFTETSERLSNILHTASPACDQINYALSIAGKEHIRLTKGNEGTATGGGIPEESTTRQQRQLLLQGSVA
ncbi:unnamed protein product [Gongylonema pulchrum]|uniref:Uncharacterized protein n=1 Tax=Gongylonema pulchrum TaxID=637853 RepID=A0A183EIM1_9BILA|nr:unnamed protein product [Gongylonema pulchrum]